MKAIFPCKGVVIITKPNVNMIYNYYTEKLENSPLYEQYMQSDVSIELGKFKYLPKKSSIVLSKNSHLLTVQELTEAVNKMSGKEQKSEKIKPENTIKNNKPLEDCFIENHPFFQTLKPLK